jgi:hypothetical protein
MATISFVVRQDPPRVDLTATFTDAAVTTASFGRISAGGLTITLRSGATVPVVNKKATITDWEVPLDTAVVYEVVQVLPSTGTESGQGKALTVQSDPTGGRMRGGGYTWLSDPAVSDRALRLDEVQGQKSQNRVSRAGVFAVIDRPKPIVVSSRRASFVGELEFYTATLQQRTTVLDIISRGQVLLLRTPDYFGLGTIYVHVGDVLEERITALAREPSRRWSLPLTEVDRPEGFATMTEGMRWIDVNNRYANWQAVYNTGFTWAELLDQPPL